MEQEKGCSTNSYCCVLFLLKVESERRIFSLGGNEMKNRTKSRWKKIVLGLGLFLVILVIGLTIFIKNSTYQATDSALKISQSATQEKNYDYYTNGQKNDTA
ncbi:alpha/beta hydrolase, partial [Enterococcus faecalis]